MEYNTNDKYIIKGKKIKKLKNLFTIGSFFLIIIKTIKGMKKRTMKGRNLCAKNSFKKVN